MHDLCLHSRFFTPIWAFSKPPQKGQYFCCEKNVIFVLLNWLSYSTVDNQGTAYLLAIPSQKQAAKILHEQHCWISQQPFPWAAVQPPCTPPHLPSPAHSEQRAVVCSQGLLKPCPPDLFASLECNHNIAEATKSLARFGSLFLNGKKETAPNPVLRQDIHWFMWVGCKTGPILIYSFIHRHQT